MKLNNKRFLFLAVGATVLSVIGGVGAWFLWPSSPAVALSTHQLDLGDGEPGEKMRGSFQIHNIGSEPLEYQIQSTCGCTELEPRSGKILPGGSQDVSLALQLPQYANSKESVRVVIKSNDPDRPAVTCSVTARCPSPFEVTPRFVNLDHLVREDLGSVSEVLEIRGPGGGGLEEGKQLRLRHESEYIEIARERAEDGVTRLTISLSPHTPCTELYDTLELRLGDSDRVVNVPMHVRVVDRLSVMPSRASLEVDAATGAFPPLDLFVLDRSGRGGLTFHLLDTPEWMTLESLERTGGSNRVQRLRLHVGKRDAGVETGVTLHLQCESDGGLRVKWSSGPPS